jgi:hypothetical protein
LLLVAIPAHADKVRPLFDVTGSDAALGADERALHRAHTELLGILPGQKPAAGTQFVYQVVPQAIFPERTLVAASGSADGGHILLSPRLLLLERGQVTHVLAQANNLDADGYHRQLVDVFACRPGYYRGLYQGEALLSEAKLAALRARECRSLWPEVRAKLADAREVVRVLAILQDDGHAAKIVEKLADLEPRLQTLVTLKKTSEARWVPGARAQVPRPVVVGAPYTRGWLTVTAERTTWFQRFELEASAGKLALTTEQVGYTVSVIE